MVPCETTGEGEGVDGGQARLISNGEKVVREPSLTCLIDQIKTSPSSPAVAR